MVALTAVDLIHTGADTYMNTTEGPLLTYATVDGSRSSVESVRAMTQETFPPGRIDVMGTSHDWAAAASLLRLPAAGGDDPLALARILKLRLCFAEGNLWERYYQVSSPASPVLDLLNIRFVLTRPDQMIAGGKFIPREDLPNGTRVYENLKALPRFFFVSEIRYAKDINASLALLCSPRFDATRMAVVSDTSDRITVVPSGSPGVVRTLRYSDKELELDVNTPNAALLVTSEAYYPGWRAWIDGQEQPLVLTNAAFRGLRTPAGHHRIEMRFVPRILWYGASISFLSMLLLSVKAWTAKNPA